MTRCERITGNAVQCQLCEEPATWLVTGRRTLALCDGCARAVRAALGAAVGRALRVVG